MENKENKNEVVKNEWEEYCKKFKEQTEKIEEMILDLKKFPKISGRRDLNFADLIFGELDSFSDSLREDLEDVEGTLSIMMTKEEKNQETLETEEKQWFSDMMDKTK